MGGEEGDGGRWWEGKWVGMGGGWERGEGEEGWGWYVEGRGLRSEESVEG